MLNWQIKSFSALSGLQVYQMLKLRQDVFILEQNCLYGDADDADQQATHLFLMDDHSEQFIAYCRLLPAGTVYQEAAIGRVVIAASHRNKGFAKLIIKQAVDYIKHTWKAPSIKISAQSHLLALYQAAGFFAASDPYDEDGIEHIDMFLK